MGIDVRLEVELTGGPETAVVGQRGNPDLRAQVATLSEAGQRSVEPARGLSERDLVRVIKQAGVERAMIAGGFSDLSARTRLIHELIAEGLAVDQISGGPETLYSNAVFHDLEGLPVLSVRPTAPRPLARRLKRLIDIVLSALGLLVLSPVLAWAAIRIKRDSDGPVFYRQERCGLNDEPFELVKLRTMYEGSHAMRSDLRKATEGEGNDDVLFKVEDDPRVTPVGASLRRTSIDEIPQLWNVLKGDMSMVGPRPLVYDEAREATDLFASRTEMKPGIAGPWQAFGRSSIPFEDMIKLDYAYVVGWSMAEDMRLLLRTVTAVVRGSGAH